MLSITEVERGGTAAPLTRASHDTRYLFQHPRERWRRGQHQSILSTIGHTPLVRLTRAFPDCPFRLFAKLEGFNPGGSAKDRPALNILREAMRTGALKPWSVVIESSSGNLGIGLAQVCRYLGLRFICVVDPNTTAQNIRILGAYGAEIDLVSKPDPVTGGFLQARIDRVQTLLQTIEDSFWTNQYGNLSN